MDRQAAATRAPELEAPDPRQEPAQTAASARPERSTSTLRLPPLRTWRPSRAAVIALVVGLLVTAALALATLAIYHRNEQRLLNLRVREVGLVLGALAPSVQTPLASGAEVARATGGDPARFREFFSPQVGLGRQFASVSLWRLGNGHPTRTAVVGVAPKLGSARLAALAADPGVLNVAPLLAAAPPSLAFVYSTSAGRNGAFAVLAENPLPANRHTRAQSNTAFSDLDYVLYLGSRRSNRELLLSSVAHPPIRGRQASTVVPFGTAAFTLVVAPRGSLGGRFFGDLPWIIGLAGLLLAVAGGILIDRLSWGRQQAEALAGVFDRVADENRRMYVEQHSISQTLQHALLPDTLPEVAGLSVQARYIPAPTGADVGGDWYDALALDDERLMLIVGDVSGHGLEAATTMALLRHAALAYAAREHSPGGVLTQLSDFVAAREHTYFATVLCALVDVERHTLTLASAGHLPPLLLERGEGRFIDVPTSPPVGFNIDAPQRETTVEVAPNATLVAFTDGLVERRGEVLDVGLQRLRSLAIEVGPPVPELLDRLAQDLSSEHNHDDTALVGIEWLS